VHTPYLSGKPDNFGHIQKQQPGGDRRNDNLKQLDVDDNMLPAAEEPAFKLAPPAEENTQAA
jgi:hypothetical protein